MKNLIISFKMLVFFSIITGILYPLTMTLFGQLIFPNKANGSLIYNGKQIIGSELIGQKFVSPAYFCGRSSAIDYNPLLF